jgi:SNF family Na+-dependent transporter
MSTKERWATRFGLVLAMAGNAVGLGNFLRFPAQAAQNGGGAFIIPYLVALLVMGLPLIWVEWAMGRYGGQRGHHSAPGILQSMARSKFWRYFGVFGLWTNLVVAAYYLYIESWCMVYAFYSYLGGFAFEEPQAFFDRLIGTRPNEVFAISGWGLGAFFICIAINIWVLSRGLAKGIELVAKIGMPLLIAFGIVLAVRGLLLQPGVDPEVKYSPLEGLNFVWQPNYSSLLNPSVWLAAAGQIFFTLSIGLGSIHCYASYLREQDDITLTGATAAWTNEFCEVILGGTILIPIAAAYIGLDGVQAQGHFALGFMVLPKLFNNWGAFAPFAGFMWFGLLFFAAITSSLAMGQPIMAFLQDEFRFSRGQSALAFGALLLPLSGCVAIFAMGSFFDEFDYWAGTFALVIFALGETILFAWIFGMGRGWAEMMKGAELRVPWVFYPIIKYVTPVFLLVILIGYALQPVGLTPADDPSTGEPKRDSRTGEVVLVEKGWEAYLTALFTGRPMPAWEFSSSSMVGKLMHKDLEKDIAKISEDAKLSPAERAAKIAYYENLKMARNFDRAVMVGVFLFFAALVSVAWSRRQAEGRG